jgi:hypothetical protein
MSEDTFTDRTRDAALRFLQTAVVIDDGATMDIQAEVGEPIPDVDLGAATRAAERDIDEEDQVGGSELPPPVQVDVGILSEAFAEDGIACGVLKPVPGDTKTATIKRIAKVCSRADLVILDWILDTKTNSNSKKAVQKIVGKDREATRVIAIYTSQGLSDIHDELMGAFDDAEEIEADEPTIQIGGTRIVLFKKGGAGTGATSSSGLREADLAKKIIDIFIGIVEGWVRAVALHGMAAIRENVHGILTRLDRRHDAGFAGQMLRLDHREEGPQHLLHSLGGEFRDVVADDQRTQAMAGLESLFKWVDQRETEGRMPVAKEGIERLFSTDTKKEKSAVENELKNEAIENHPQSAPESMKLFRGRLTGLFVHEFARDEALLADSALARLLSLRHHYGGGVRSLHLGTIMEDKSEQYWLCMQPVCDSVRIASVRHFPMLPLVKTEPGDEGHDVHLVLDGDQGDLFLSNPGKPQLITMFEFESDPTKEKILFRKDRRTSERPFVRSTDKTVFQWLGELKPVHSNRVAHHLGRELARVGLDESVWLHEQSS